MENINFSAGKNIALKVPEHEYTKTVDFYKKILNLTEVKLDNSLKYNSAKFEFGDKFLWIDKVNSISQAEIWLEINTNDIKGAEKYLAEHNCIRCDEIEKLPDDFKGFWVSSPANIIHLISE